VRFFLVLLRYQSVDDFIDRRDSSRTLSPVAFFHDGIIINKTDLHNNLMEIQRRAQAIATAPRRKRFDDDKEEIEQNKSIKISYQISI
jgi:hypothetical protein